MRGSFCQITNPTGRPFPTNVTKTGKQRAAFKFLKIITSKQAQHLFTTVVLVLVPFLTMSNSPHAIEVSPDTELQFTLSRSADDPSKCVLTLRHPGTTDEHLAFKVRQSQGLRMRDPVEYGIVSTDYNDLCCFHGYMCPITRRQTTTSTGVYQHQPLSTNGYN